jgi:hypothetical protein
MVRWVILHVVPNIGAGLCLVNTQGILHSWMPSSNCETWRWIYDDLGSNILVFCSSYNYSEWLITANDYVDTLGNQLHLMVHMLFPNNNAVFQDDNSPIHTAGSIQSWFEKHADALQHIPWPTQLPEINIIKQLRLVRESSVRSWFPTTLPFK